MPSGGTPGIGARRIAGREEVAGVLGHLPHSTIHPVLEPEEAVYWVGPRSDGHVPTDVVVATGAAHHVLGARDNGVVQGTVRDCATRAEEHNGCRLYLKLRCEDAVLHEGEVPGKATES